MFIRQEYGFSQWDQKETEYTAGDVDEQLLIDYVNKGNECGRIDFSYSDVETTLRKLELLNGEHLNNAGYYLFSNKEPLLLRLAVFPAEERIRFSDIKQFRGNIFECIHEAVKYVLCNINWKVETVGKEKVEVPEVPVEAIREIIVNSFAHMRAGDICSHEIYITPSKIHIYNPGPILPGITPQMFASGKQGAMFRNPLIASCLYYNKTMEASNTGFKNVFSLCSNMNYKYRNDQFGFVFEFLRNSNQIAAISDSEKELLKLIRTGKRFTRQNFADAIGKSQSTIQRYLNHLTKLGLIRRDGSNKNGLWVAAK